jgi:hypothetical protein
MPSGAVTALGYPDTSLARFSDADVLNRVIYRPALTSDLTFMKTNGYFSPLLMNTRFGGRYNKKECKQFKKNPKLNPRTGKRLKKNTKVYRKLTKDCKRPVKQRVTQNVCKKFIESANNGTFINPRTGKKININSPIYKLLVDKCKRYSTNNISNKINSNTQTESMNYNNVPSFFIGNKPSVPNDEFEFYNGVQPSIPPSVQRKLNIPIPSKGTTRKKTTGNLEPKINGEINGINYIVIPNESISFGGKTFKIQDNALINNTEYGKITNIGKSMILLTRTSTPQPDSSRTKQRRLYHPSFVLLNS